MDNTVQNHKNRNIYLLLIVLTCSITYFNSLTAGFLILDDPLYLDYIKSAHFSFKELFLPTVFDRYYRPIVGLAGLVTHYFFAYNPAAFHLTNIMIHLMNSVLVYFLSLEIAGQMPRREEVALIASLLFAVHPLNSEAVIWIAARAELFFCFFSLSFLILLSKNKTHVNKTSLVGLFLLYLCALLSKESGIMLFPLTVIFLVFERKKLADKDFTALIIAMLVATACYFYMRNGMNLSTDSVVSKVVSAGRPGRIAILGNLAACGFYLGKMLYPYPLSIAITNISVTISLILFGVTVPVLLYLFYSHKPLHIPVLFILTGLFPPLIAFNVNTSWTPYAERYMYAPMAGFAVLAGYCLICFARKIPFIVLLSGALLLSIPTIYRAGEWNDPLSYWRATTEKTPEFTPVRLVFAAELMNAGRYDEAEQQLAKAKSMGFPREKDRKAYEEFLADIRQKRSRAGSL